MERRASQRGFSMIEVLIAMVVTLIISGAIYGLLSSGQSAFRREPSLVDRQQNIRIAMDLIARDVQNAGAGMIIGAAQIFTNNLNNPAAPGSVASEISPGQRADYLEMLVNDGSCPSMGVCASAGATLFTTAPLPACIFGNPATSTFVYVSGSAGPAGSADPLHPGLLFSFVPGPGPPGPCGGNGFVNFPAGQAPAYNPPGGGCGGGPPVPPSTVCQSISRIQFARYELAAENPLVAVNPVTNPPSLWRSEYGRRNPDGSANAGPYVGDDPSGNPNPWQVLARGIDDMQIQYFTACPSPGGPLGWCNIPGARTLNLNTVVQQVRITLSARATAANLGGETTYVPGAGTPGRRGQLTTTIAPRSALQILAVGNQWR